MGKKSPVERTLAWLREQNIEYAVASGYNSFSRKRWDLIGVIDYVAFYPTNNVYKLVGIQICGKDWTSHVKKINNSRLARKWVASGNTILLIGWRELKSGWTSRKATWEARGDFTSNVQSSPLIHPKVPDVSQL